MNYYFLTLDYANTQHGEPDKKMYEAILKYQYELFDLMDVHHHYPIKCYEEKHKSKKYLQWLHYHCLVRTGKYIPFRDAQCKNWSIKYIRINTIEDAIAYSGYIMKDKIDKIYINKYTCY